MYSQLSFTTAQIGTMAALVDIDKMDHRTLPENGWLTEASGCPGLRPVCNLWSEIMIVVTDPPAVKHVRGVFFLDDLQFWTFRKLYWLPLRGANMS